MSKWRLFGKSKKEEKNDFHEPVNVENNPVEPEEIQEFEAEPIQQPEPQDQPLVEHHDTLHTGKPSNEQGSSANSRSSSDQRVWRDVEAIEENIDNIHVKNSGNPPSELDKKVDQIIKKKEKK